MGNIKDKIILFLLFVSILFPGCRKPSVEPEATLPEVYVEKVSTSDIRETIYLIAELQPFSKVILTSKVAGRLESLRIETDSGSFLPVEEGVYVRKGNILGRIDIATYEAKINLAKANLDIAEAQLMDAIREEKRIVALYESGSATEQMRDKACTARLIAEAVRNQAEASFTLAKLEFEEATLKAPLDGVITKKHIDAGNIVHINTPIVTIEDISKIKVIVPVPERYLHSITGGVTSMKIYSKNTADNFIKATVYKIYPTVDSSTRNCFVEAIVDNTDMLLRPGSFTEVELELRYIKNSILIPSAAIIWESKDRSYVFVLENDKVRLQDVKTGIREGEKCQILSGLKEGDVFVVRGISGIKDGDRVKIKER